MQKKDRKSIQFDCAGAGKGKEALCKHAGVIALPIDFADEMALLLMLTFERMRRFSHHRDGVSDLICTVEALTEQRWMKYGRIVLRGALVSVSFPMIQFIFIFLQQSKFGGIECIA